MSTHYTTEPTPTASATLHTTLGALHISLFATQAPLTVRNFLQHCQDGYYNGTIFHRVVPEFIIQGGDPTGTGSGGTSIYEDPEFEYDPDARDPNEKVVLRDELHSRLRFNRRGLVGMAKSEDGSYGSQFFVTLANTERELNGQCTLFGRVEGESIYNMVKIAEAERVEGTERPVYPVKVVSCEIGELGPLEGKIKKRTVTASLSAASTKVEDKPAKKKKKTKGSKTLLSFGDDADEDMPIRPAKPKFNASLVTDTNINNTQQQQQKETKKRPRSPSPEPKRLIKPPPETQLPLPDPESPPSPEPEPKPKQSTLSRTNAEIESLKASMRRTIPTQADHGPKKSALEAMIPETAIRGRKRPPPGTSTAANGTQNSNKTDNEALKLFNAFKAKLETASSTPSHPHITHPLTHNQEDTHTQETQEKENQEEELCDLHFIANCQSCQSWSNETKDNASDDDSNWLNHELRFGKDMLGKDLSWKKEHPDDADSLMVIDPREREKEFVGKKKGRGLERDRERERKKERVGGLEWRK
ncbi:cyclophilin-like domain-containing protein [Aspergillus avenaceus]|uniref:Peptidyl-prolyl isomerase CWC27 n=1 Tax=Aspergillus avenaceus TaxID=36643 RepID=A0A5N6TJV3_ASPAV|nr:cyclophilin-like domain-containing protein [Aspergillus avenaceus]